MASLKLKDIKKIYPNTEKRKIKKGNRKRKVIFWSQKKALSLFRNSTLILQIRNLLYWLDRPGAESPQRSA